MLLTSPLIRHEQKKILISPHRDISELLPISSLIANESSSLSKEKLIFCYRAVIQALHAYLVNDYTKFDAQTTTNCCHGMSLLVHKTINEISVISVQRTLLELEIKLERFEKKYPHDLDLSRYSNHPLSKPILTLAQLYILSIIKEKDSCRGGWITVIQKLNKIGSISTKFGRGLVKKLQLLFSNLIADSYQSVSKHIPDDFIINDLPITLWGKYIHSNYIKIDKRGRKYAACLYSMQVVLAYLIQQQAKIAFICDLKSEQGVLKDRYIQLLSGDGRSNFKLLAIDNMLNNEPVIIFGGCTHSDYLDKKSLEFQLTPWLSRFPSLVLACDVFYPQFPSVSDDPEFDNSPIEPREGKLKYTIDQYKQVHGVSAYDPSFFCLAHIYVASLKQVQQEALEQQNTLPLSHIPENKLFTPVHKAEQIA